MTARPLAHLTAVLRTIGAVAAVVVVLAVGPPTSAAGPVDDEAQFIALVNQARAGGGVAPLAVHDELTAVGRSWAGSMAGAGGISHNPSLAAQVSAPWLLLGENVGRGGSVQAIFDALMASPSHRRNIMDGRFTHIGVGVVHAPDGTIYTSHQFMQLGSAPAPPPPPPPAPAAAPVAPATPPPAAAPEPEPTPAPAMAAGDTSPASSLPPVTVPIADRRQPVPLDATSAAGADGSARAAPAAPPTDDHLDTAAEPSTGDDIAPGRAATVALAGATPLTVAYVAVRRRRSGRSGPGRSSAA